MLLLPQVTSRIWKEISESTYLFERKQLKAEYLSKISLKDILEFFDKYLLLSDNSSRRKFSSQFFGAGHPYPEDTAQARKKQVVIIQDPPRFKSTLPLLAAKSFIDNVESSTGSTGV